MIRSPYKNVSGKLEKGVYVCVYLLYGTHMLGFYVCPFYFFSFVPRNMTGYFVSISSFLFDAPPRTSPLLPKITSRNGRFSKLLYLFSLNGFRKRTGLVVDSSSSCVHWSPFVHGNHTGALCFVFCSQGVSKVYAQMAKKGEGKVGQLGSFPLRHGGRG